MSNKKRKPPVNAEPQVQYSDPRAPGYAPPNAQPAVGKARPQNQQPAYASSGSAVAERAGGISAKKSRRIKWKAKTPAVDKAYTSKNYKEKILTGPMDLPFFIIVMVLLVMGVVMMFSASYAIAISETGDGLQYVKKQLFFAGVGLVAMLIISRIDYHFYANKIIAWGAYLGGIALLIAVLILPNKRADDFHRWIYIGGFGFQPSEVMKLSIIIIFAYLISSNYSRMKDYKHGVLPFLVLLGIAAVLIYKEPHVSGTVIVCAIGFSMMFVGGSKISHLVTTGLVGVGGVVALTLYLVSIGEMKHIQNRIACWLTPFDPTLSQKDTWQTCQSLIAIGSGGMFGLGLGNSRQKYLYLPEAENDFVFAIVCEELGFIGAMMVVLLFALFIFRGFYIASKSPDKFGMMLTVGITMQIGIQALLNIAVVTNTIPNTGISLPFFSYGGTALIIQLAEMGIILNISRQSAILKT